MNTQQLDERLYRTDADNGITVLSERLPGVRSAAVGIWVATASAHEDPAKMGISHLLEHMVFKGTERRSARDIALALEIRGGSLDAYTSRDHTSYQARILDEDLPLALDVLTDLVRNPVLRDADLDLERNVVLEEISSVEDTPDDFVFDLHTSLMWPHHPYGHSILGTRDTITKLRAVDLRELHRQRYHPRHVVIAVAGNVEHDLLLRLLTKYGWFTFEPGPSPPDIQTVPPSVQVEQRIQRDSSQQHIVFGSSTFPYRDARRYPLVLLNTVFGAGMSSRLFQRVREELGLAYAVYSYQSFYRETGAAGVYVGTQPGSAVQAADAVREAQRNLAAHGLSEQELAAAKQQLKGQIMLSLESPSARMYRLATIALYSEPYRTLETVLQEIDAVNGDSVANVASEFFDPERQTVVWLGPN